MKVTQNNAKGRVLGACRRAKRNLNYFECRDSRCGYLLRYQEKGNYRIISTVQSPDVTSICFNMFRKDPILKELLNDKCFRKELGARTYPTVSSGAPLYGERVGKRYLEYNPELANQLSDGIGLTKRDKEGQYVLSSQCCAQRLLQERSIKCTPPIGKPRNSGGFMMLAKVGS